MLPTQSLLWLLMTQGNASVSQAGAKNHCIEELLWWGNETVLVTAKLNTMTAATHAFHVLGSSGTKQRTLIGSGRHAVQFKSTITVILTNSNSSH